MKTRKLWMPLIACALACTMAQAALAAQTSPPPDDLKAKFSALQQQMQALQAQLNQVTTQIQEEHQQAQQAQKAQPQVQQASVIPGIQMKPGPGLTFLVGGGEVTLYGKANVSFDAVDNGLSGRAGAVGRNGWLPQVASNNSLFGIRGDRAIANNLKALFQFETDIQFAATPGNNCCINSGAHDSSVKGALGSRNSFVGLEGSWGAIKLGKTDAPYKTTTQRLDPFANTLGDYRSIISNSGGDNRVEFASRVPHAIWYESPKLHGFSGALLFSPGQNRSVDNSLTARGEPNCTGGNIPDGTCSDGAFGNLWSAALAYANGPFYATAAYEMHKDVNRTGDELSASDGVNPPLGSVGVANESAVKLGLQYTYEPTRTTVGVLWERLHRNAPVSTFNERSRNNAFYVSLVQKVFHNDEVDFAWAHAGKTDGDPGVAVNQPGVPLTSVAGPIANQANMFALGYKHRFEDKHTTWYILGAIMKNQQGAHYDLGAGASGAPVDCHDGAGNCFTGTTLKAVSTGLIYAF